MQHKMVLIKQTKSLAEWQCPACQRHVRICRHQGLKVLSPGEQEINHGSASTVPGLQLGQTAVNELEVH